MPFDLRHHLHGTSWLCDPAAIRRYAATLSRIPTCPSAREIVAFRAERLAEAKQAAAKAVRAQKGKVGVIPVYGPISQRADALEVKLGGTSTEEVSVALDALVADPAVSAIVLHVDSPGGSSYGVEELSDKIYAAREKKHIYAIADSMAASAAYWIASAAGHLAVTPGGDVGSVGVYCVHVDESKALEAEGISVSVVSAGKHKVETASHQPLSEDARAYLQEQVNATYDKFAGALRRNRNTTREHVEKHYGQGRVLNAEQAMAAGMVDSVRSFEELLGKLTGGASPGDRRASMDVLRKRHELAKARMGGRTL